MLDLNASQLEAVRVGLELYRANLQAAKLTMVGTLYRNIATDRIQEVDHLLIEVRDEAHGMG